MTLTLSGGHEVISHPVWVILVVPFLLGTALTYVALSAVRSALWLRILILLGVSSVLIYLGWSLGVLTYLLIPVLLLDAYILWRGAQGFRHLPTHKDVLVIGGLVFGSWSISVVFGLRIAQLGALGTLYLGVAELVTIAVFLPAILLLLAGMDIAELFAGLTEKIRESKTIRESRVTLVMLFLLSVGKVGFYVWELPSKSV